MDINQIIEKFFRVAMNYFGHEIALPSNQLFEINQVVDENKDNDCYSIQYGFPQSGGVTLSCEYSKENNSFIITDVSVYAPPKGENIVMAIFAPQADYGDFGIRVNMGIDTGAKKHETIREIEENPNAIKMFDIAISDLRNAEVLGEYRVAVPIGSKHIPCCQSTQNPRTKGRYM